MRHKFQLQLLVMAMSGLSLHATTLGFSTYLGGPADDYGNHTAVDRDGNVYVVGSRPSARGTDYDAYVAKYNNSGRLLWITNVGGNCDDSGRGIALDATGNAYITGALGFSCWDWNTRPGAFGAKVSAAGRTVYFFPFSADWSYADVGQAIAVDAQGNAYITGVTNSRYFPVTARAFQRQLRSEWLGNGFVVKINPLGRSLVYATYLGGDTYESANGIAVDAQGNAYITGHTESSDFPTTPNAFQRTRPSMGTGTTGFVTKLNRDGSALVYSTYLGGQYNDVAYAIAIDTGGNAYVTGETESDNFPTTPGAVQPNPGDNRLCYYKLCTDVFVTKLNANGSGLIYSTFIGGRLWETGHRIAVDGQGNAHVTGRTFSYDFPLARAFQLMRRGDHDAFVVKLNAAGSAFVYSTYLGGDGADSGVGIAADLTGNTYVTGVTNSIDFPTRNAQQPLPGGGDCWTGPCNDAFVVKIGH
jgi:hypothetical protein